MQQASPTIRNAALTALLENLVDYAGLFPPAKLDMQPAVENYSRYAEGQLGWMLGKFIAPAARLTELESSARSIESPGVWNVSALLAGDIATDIKQVTAFNVRNRGRLTVTSVELKASAPADIQRAHSLMVPDLQVFFEIPLSADIESCLDALARCKRKAKIRTGGETPEMIPAAGSVAGFIGLCADKGVPFKATAGLHHPLCSLHRLTYAPDSPSATMHGFLNVFLAAVLLAEKRIDVTEASELLNEPCANSFGFADDGVIWRSHRATTENIRLARKSFALSFGSCSFSEPVEDLQALSLL
jgi:hypothetical protein